MIRKATTFVLMMAFALFVAPAASQDAREAARKAAADRAEAEARAMAVENEILADRARLISEVESLEREQERLEAQLAAVQTHIGEQERQRERLTDRWAQHELQFKEISGNVRLAAKEVETLLHQSPFTADSPQRLDRIRPLVEPGYFPDIDDISGLAATVFDELQRSGQVRLHEGAFIGRDGQETQGTILTLGKFTAAYRTAAETGFLDYSAERGRFVALSHLPRGSLRGDLEAYFTGGSARVPIDISAGGALRQVEYQTTLWEQIQAGGPIVWPIIGLAALALLIVVYKFIYLHGVQGNTKKIMDRMNELAAAGNWEKAEMLLDGRRGSPVGHVLSAGLAARHADRQTQESVLQEAILNQLPKVERGMAVLAVLGAVAPLLGLLGTVTGMIDTFRVITLYGTGDPKLMSGGISEALVTTMLGLSVAIPIMLLHTFLSRRVEHIVGDMEEHAVQLCNIFQASMRKAKTAAVGAA